jgi:hypothetical protein
VQACTTTSSLNCLPDLKLAKIGLPGSPRLGMDGQKTFVNAGCNTHVHGSNDRNLSVWVSSSQLAKTLYLSYLLRLLFNKVGEEGKTTTAWKRGGWEQVGEVAQTMCTRMNKCKNN